MRCLQVGGCDRTRDPSNSEAADLRLRPHGHPDRRLFFFFCIWLKWIAWFERVKLGDGLIQNPPHALMRGSGHILVNMQNKTTSCRLYPVVVSASGFNSSDSFLVTRQNIAELSLVFPTFHLNVENKWQYSTVRCSTINISPQTFFITILLCLQAALLFDYW